jgi:hypothetical protein
MRKIEPPNLTAAALVDIADAAAPPLPREAKIPMPEPQTPDSAPPVPYAKPNGNQPREARDALARGLMQFDVLKAERDQLEKDLQTARERIHLLEIHMQEIESTRAMIESRINACVLERDDAVRQAGELRGVINSVAAICVRYHDAQQQD